MRTTIELPDEILNRAKVRAAEANITLRQLFVKALESHLDQRPQKTRKAPPLIRGKRTAPAVRLLTPEEVDEAMFG